MRLRLLPVLVLTAGLALTARVGDLWQGFSAPARAQTAGGADNKPASAPASMPAGEKPAAPEAVAKDGAKEGAKDAGVKPPVEAAKPAETPMQSVRAGDLPSDPLAMTDEEIDLLQALADRRRTLADRAKELDDREAMLEAAQRRVEDQVGDLETLKKSIEGLLQQQQSESESQYQSLVKIYENMKPKDAARIFEELDMAVLIPVAERMKERKIAPILAKMDPAKAQAITVELAQRRNEPATEAAAAQK